MDGLHRISSIQIIILDVSSCFWAGQFEDRPVAGVVVTVVGMVKRLNGAIDVPVLTGVVRENVVLEERLVDQCRGDHL